jgi:hypothetical protein
MKPKRKSVTREPSWFDAAALRSKTTRVDKNLTSLPAEFNRLKISPINNILKNVCPNVQQKE